MAKKKINLLDEYINRIQSEINERAINTLKPIYKDSDLIAIDDSIVPILLVLSNDILNGNHELAINQAATIKTAGLALKSIQVGETPMPGIPDIGTLMPMFQNIMGALPMITGCLGSFVECAGANITAQNKDQIFQFGLSMHMGASSNPLKSATMREIGITIGNLYENTNKEHNYKKFNDLVKTLPRNKYRKRLQELAERYYKDNNIIETVTITTSNERSSLKNTEKPETNPSPTNHEKKHIQEEKRKDEKTKECETNELKINIVSEIEPPIKFIADPDDALVEKAKKQKQNAEDMKKQDEIKFVSGDE